MTDQQALFTSLICSGHFPPISNELLNCIEDFLIYCVKADVNFHMKCLMQYYNEKFKNRFTNLEEGDFNFQLRLLHTMRYIRPAFLTQEYSTKLEEITFSFLSCSSKEMVREAFIILVDHFISHIHGEPNRISELVDFIIDFLSNTEKAIQEIDHQLLFIIIYSFRYLLSVADETLREKVLPITIELFTKIIFNSLSYRDSANFFPALELIVAKSLRFVAFFTEWHKSFPSDSFKILLEIQSIIPDDVRFVHIYQNFIVLVCAILELNMPEFNEGELKTKIINQIMGIIPLFVYPPFNKSRRAVVFFHTLKNWLIQRDKHPPELFITILPKTLPVFGHLQGQINFLRYVYEIYQYFITADFFAFDKKGIQFDLLEQFVVSLEMTRDEFSSYDLETSSRPFDIEYWLESNIILTKLIALTITIKPPNENLLGGVAELFVRLLNYFFYFLDLSGKGVNAYAPDQIFTNFIHQQMTLVHFKERVKDYISCFIQLFIRLPQKISNYLISGHIYLFLPSKQYHNYHTMFVLQLIRSLPNPTLFHVSYFDSIVKNFDALFTEQQNTCIFYTTKNVFQEAFEKSQDQTMASQLCTSFYAFITLSIASKIKGMIELAFHLLQHIRGAKDPKDVKPAKLAIFCQLMKQSQFSYHIILKSLADDPKLETIVSILAIYLFPLLSIQNDQIEAWIILFLPALESDAHRPFACQPLLEIFSRALPIWMSKLSESTQNRLISALSKETNCVRLILSKIPDITVRNAMAVAKPPNRRILVKFNNTEIPFISLLNILEQEEKPTDDQLQIFMDCFLEYEKKLNFIDSVVNPEVVRSCELLIKNKKELLGNAYQKVENITRYSFLVLLEFFEMPVKDYSVVVEKPDEFLNYVTLLCYKPCTVKCGLTIIDKVFSLIPVGFIFLRVVTSLLHSSIYEHKYVSDIFDRHLFVRKYKPEEDMMIKVMCQTFFGAIRITTKHFRLLGLKALDFYQKHLKMPSFVDENRKNVIKDLARFQPNIPFRRFDFIFMRPFDDVPDSINVLSKLISTLTTIQITPISPEVKKLLRVTILNDKFLIPIDTNKFILKIIVKILPFVQPSKASNQVWEQLLSTLNSDKCRPLIPFFFSQFKKVASNGFPSMPGMINSLFSTSKQLTSPPSIEELQFLLIIVHFSPNPQLPQLIQWLTMAVKLYQQNALSIQIEKLSLLFTQVLKILGRIKRVDTKMETKTETMNLYKALFDFFIFCRTSLLALKVPEYEFASIDPALAMITIISTVKTTWSIEILLFICNLMTHKKNTLFRHFCFKSIFENITTVIKSLTETIKNDLDFVLLKTISSLAEIVDTLSSDDFDLQVVWQLAKTVFRIIERMNNNLSIGFKPSFIFCFTSIFLPIHHTKLIETSMLQIFISDIFTLFLSAPTLFYHPLFLRRFTNFMKALSENVRNQIWKELPSKATNKMITKVLINQMLNELFSAFPPTEKKVITVGFKDYPKITFISFVLNYSGALIGTQKNVVIEDLKDTTISYSSSQVQSLLIHNGLLDFNSVQTITRFSHISKYLSSYEGGSDFNYDEYLSKLLSVHPFMFKQSLLCFRLFGQKSFVIQTPSRSLLQFIFGLSAATLENYNRLPEKQFITCLPLVFMNLHKNGITSVAPRVVDLLIFTSVLVLTKMSDSTTIAQYIPFTLDLFVPYIDHKNDINPRCIEELRQTLEIKPNPVEPVNQTKIRFVYQLIPSLSNLLFLQHFVPNDLLPSVFIAANFPKEIVPIYQKSLQYAYIAGGYKFAREIIMNAHSTLKIKDVKLSKPLDSVFATVAEWIKESENIDQKVSQIIHILLDAFKPPTVNKAISEVASLLQPVHSEVIKCLISLEKDFDILKELKKRNPSIKIMDVFQTTNLENGILADSFNIDWFSIHQNTHKIIFLRMLLPNPLHSLIYYMKDSDIDDFIVSISQSLPTAFNRFIDFYVNSFPDSSLSSCLTQTFRFSHSFPLIKHSLFQNMYFLERSYDWNDSLGILSTVYPSLLTAASFHQISQYPAAKAHYISEMRKNQNDIYFYSLLKLRTIVLNQSLPSTSNLHDTILIVKKETNTPLITLPIFQDNSPNFEYKNTISETSLGKYATTFISPSYIPMYLKSAMIEESHQMLNVYLHHQVNFNDLLRLSTVSWTSSLDKNVSMVSNLVWRFAILDDFVKNNANIDTSLTPILPKLNEALKRNHETAAKLLVRTGSYKHGLTELKYAESLQDIIMATPTNLYRICHFISKNPNFSSTLRLSALLTLRDISSAARMMSQLSRRQSLKLFLTVQYFFPNVIDREQFIPRLFLELQQQDLEKVDRNVIISLIISLVKKDEKLMKVFSQQFSQVKDDQFDLWMNWLPIMFKICLTAPIDFMMSLLTHNTSYFLLQLHHLKNSGMIHDKIYFSEMNNEMKAKKDAISEFEGSLEFIKRCESDIQQMIRSIRAIRLFYFALIKGRCVTEYPKETKNLYSNFEELTEYIDSHPPIFTTAMNATNYTSLIGFRFPTMTQNVMRVSLESQSPNETYLNYTTIRGDSRTCLLVSPIVYKYTSSEYIFTNILQKMIDHRREEYSIIYYPQAFLIHPMLLLVNSPPASNMAHICEPHSIPKMLYKYGDISKEQLVTPKEAIDRRTASIPNDLLFKWFVKGAQGSKNDFLFMRKCFAAHFATISYLHSLFGTPQMINPPLLFYEDRQKLWFPGFMDKTITYASIAMTKQIDGLLPEFVMRGSFAASWNMLASVVVANQDKIRTCLNAIAPELAEESQQAKLAERIKGCGTHVGEDTEKSDEYFPFLYLDHLIRTSKNSLMAQPTKFGWV